MKKHYSAKHSLLVLLVVLSGGVTAVSAQCRVGDMMLLEGQKTGFLGHTCTGESAFTGTEGVCTSDGTIMQRTYEGSCSGSTPYCVQCRNPGEKGAALCLSNPDNAPASCIFNSDNRELLADQTAPEGCLVGDIMYLDGDSVGVIGETCLDEASYTGSKSTCRNGQVVEEPYEGTCASFCVQCGSPGDRGAALCLNSPEVPEHCATAAESQSITDPVQNPVAAAGGDCLVGDIMYQNGDTVGTIGMVCVSSTEYSGAQSTCIDGEVVSTPYEGQCGQGFCVQCGSPGSWGAALCLDSLEVPESCDTFVSNADNPGAMEDCLVGDIMYRHGDNIGFIGETCTGESAFIGTESFCEDGQVVRKPYSGACESSVQFCVQCGEPGEWGAALCLSEPTQPPGCSFDEASAEAQQPQGDVPRGPSMDPIAEPVLDGPLGEPARDELTPDDPSGASLIVDTCDFSSAWGSIYAEGDTVGVLMLTCNSDGKGFVGAETLCRGGQLVSQPMIGACGDALYCVQCESPGGSGNPWGGSSAMCSSSKDDVPEHCDSVNGIHLSEGFLDDSSGVYQMRQPMGVLGMSLAAVAAAAAVWFMQL